MTNSKKSNLLVSAGILFMKNGVALDSKKALSETPFLMTSRPLGKFMEGYWEFPGGKIESDESPKKALCRELFEEINIQVFQKDLMFILKRIHEYETFSVTLYVFKVLKWAGNLKPKEGQQVAFMTKEESLTKPVLPSNKDLLRDLC